jgi:uncharacterized lipoprotein YbaY
MRGVFFAALALFLGQGLSFGQDYYRDRDAGTASFAFSATRPDSLQMGVRGLNRETGVEITEVIPGSPAARAGLSPGDKIITVEGYQVGYVGQRLFDLNEECNRRVGTNGIVRMTVRQRSTGQDANYEVPLGVTVVAPVAPVAPATPVIPVSNPGWGQAIISGTIQNSTPISIPYGSVLWVQLFQEGVDGQPAISVADSNMPNITSFPVSYVLQFRQSNILPGRRYYLEARLFSGAQTLLQPVQRNWVFGNESSRLDVTLGQPQPAANAQNVNEIITSMYRKYLGREPDLAGMQAHLASLHSGRKLVEVQTNLLASNEFFDRCLNNGSIFVNQLFQMVLDRQPTGAENTLWLQQFQFSRGNRAKMVHDFLMQYSPYRTW